MKLSVETIRQMGLGLLSARMSLNWEILVEASFLALGYEKGLLLDSKRLDSDSKMLDSV